MLLILLKGFLDVYFIVSILRFYNPISAFSKVPLVNKINICVVTVGIVVEFYLILKKRGKIWHRKFVLPYMWFTGLSVIGILTCTSFIFAIANFYPAVITKKSLADFLRNWNALLELFLFVIGFYFFIVAYKNAVVSQKHITLDNESTGFLDDFAQ